ncbi:hypothetical protein N7E02_07335 (plasmid) [Aliirhizobium terrae]|uniref:hypothetical protein n=1 Tax=Terrirhizobium terrae TaxID=2926709 RepID=UPI002576D870|nr:hypothetical protein [Rhizobium sp. CC-CFT758]WJH38434.1 hypothetical protein N7E02_07335 [Rhizobium sp. CC-CFT758]
MTARIDTQNIDEKNLKAVMSVRDFCLMYKLTSDEQIRLLRLLGTYATKHELLMNARMKPRIRY